MNINENKENKNKHKFKNQRLLPKHKKLFKDIRDDQFSRFKCS